MKLIVGMHRSGTSLVARLAFEAGADLGDPEDFYRPDRWNPDGYFEQTDIHAVNMPLIHGRVGRLSYFFLPSETTIVRRARAYREEIRRTGEKYAGKVVKENRFCLTLPAWLASGTSVESLLFVLREPFEVARSLRARNRTPMRLGYSLWRTHNRRLWSAAREHDIPTRFALYSRLLDPETGASEAARVFDAFEIDIAPARIGELVSEIVAARPAAADPALPRYPAGVDALWRELRERHAAQVEAERSSTVSAS